MPPQAAAYYNVGQRIMSEITGEKRFLNCCLDLKEHQLFDNTRRQTHTPALMFREASNFRLTSLLLCSAVARRIIGAFDKVNANRAKGRKPKPPLFAAGPWSASRENLSLRLSRAVILLRAATTSCVWSRDARNQHIFEIHEGHKKT